VIQHYTTNSGTAVTESAEQDSAAVIHFIMVRWGIWKSPAIEDLEKMMNYHRGHA